MYIETLAVKEKDHLKFNREGILLIQFNIL